MAPTRRALLGAVAAGALAGCLDGIGSNGDATQTPTDTPMDGGTGPSAVVQVRSHAEHGDVLVGPDELTLYAFTRDSPGKSVCYDQCANAWPPLTVERAGDATAGSDVTGEIGTIERDDGNLQVTVGDVPLYYFASDEEPGDAMGQEVANAWFVTRPDGSLVKPTVSVRDHSDLGQILTDADGMTLYMFDSDEQNGGSTCSGGCADAWPPLTVESTDALVDSVRASLDLGTTERDDGSLQVTGAGWPLYYFASDQEPGDVKGQGVNDVWWVLRPDGAVVRASSTQTESQPPTTTATPTPENNGGVGY